MSEDTEIPGDEPVMTGEVLPESDVETPPAPAPEPEPAPEPAPEPEPATEAEPERDAKVKTALNRRFGELTAKAREEAAARQQEAELRAKAEARAAAAEALVRQLGGEVPAHEGPKPQTAEELRAQVRAEMEREQAAQSFNARCNEVFQAGQKAFPDFADAVSDLQNLGVLRSDDATFLSAVLEADAPEKVLHHLAQDPVEATRIAQLPPISQAAALVKLSAKLATPPAPKPKPVSAAPAPIEPIGGATDKGFDPLDESIPIDVWMEEMDRRDAARRKKLAERGY